MEGEQLSNLQEKVNKSIERLKAFEPEEGYYLAFSGGKDSVVCKALLDMSNCKYDATYRVTSVDPPELVRFIKDQHPDVSREVPRYENGKPITMWNLIPKKLTPPTRLIRYCCEFLKESGGDGRKTVTGVRWAESTNRRQNQGAVTILKKNKQIIEELSDNPDFSPTIRGGGGADKRQCRIQAGRRKLLQKNQGNNKSDHRVGRLRCVGIYQGPRDPVLLPV